MVFFSGTDIQELKDNAPAHNYYLSLIVNNYMDFCAKVAFIGKVEEEERPVYYNAFNSNGVRYSVFEEAVKITNTKLFVYNCNIISPKQEIVVSEDFSSKVSILVEESEKKAAIAKEAFNFHPSVGKSWQRGYDFDNTLATKKDTLKEDSWDEPDFSTPSSIVDFIDYNFLIEVLQKINNKKVSNTKYNESNISDFWLYLDELIIDSWKKKISFKEFFKVVLSTYQRNYISDIDFEHLMTAVIDTLDDVKNDTLNTNIASFIENMIEALEGTCYVVPKIVK